MLVSAGMTELLLTVTERIEAALTPNSGNCRTAKLTATEALVRSRSDRWVTEVSFQLHRACTTGEV